MKPEFPFRFLAVEGNIGAGKTRLAQALSSLLGADLLLEEFDRNPHIRSFYDGDARAHFPLESSLRTQRHEQLAHYFNQAPDQRAAKVVSDFHPLKAQVFSKVNLSVEEQALFEAEDPFREAPLPLPDLLLYLRPSLENLQRQIKQRGRSYEQSIDPTYLQNLEKAYAEFLNAGSLSGLILIVDLEDDPPPPPHLLARAVIAYGTGHPLPSLGKTRIFPHNPLLP